MENDPDELRAVEAKAMHSSIIDTSYSNMQYRRVWSCKTKNRQRHFLRAIAGPYVLGNGVIVATYLYEKI